MTEQAKKTAREVAVAALDKFDPKRNYAAEILNRLFDLTDQKQRATDLVLGTTRNLAAIEMVITKIADCPIKRIPRTILNIIRIATYELIYAPQIAQHAIVNEAVELAKKIVSKKQVGFVNAVLRQITRHIKNRLTDLSKTERNKTIPQSPSSGCEFDVDILPSSEQFPADYLSKAFSLPKWLITDWIGEFGLEQTEKICFACNRKPSIYIRPNALKTNVQKLTEKFLRHDFNCQVIKDSMIKVKSSRAISKMPGFSHGLFCVQDITASYAVKKLEPEPGWTILDLCAAPGGKTTQLAEATKDTAKIIATDIDSKRLEKVKENADRLGIKSIELIPYEKVEETASQLGFFDAVLLDVPCSNTGVLSKRPEARYRLTRAALKKLAKTQSQLLDFAAGLVKPQGRICYSTCSIQKQENTQLVKNFLQKNPSFALESELLTLSSAQDGGSDGGYVAILKKK